MLFSIITICKNDRNRLLDTMKSVLSQSFDDFEYIIKDGNSSDGTKEMIKSYIDDYATKVKLFVEKDSGIYDAMNQAALKARGDYVCFLNAGDYFLTDKTLSNVKKYIEGRSDGEVFYGNAIMIYPNGTENSQVISLDEDKLLSDDVLESGDLHLIHQAVFVNKSIFLEHKFKCEYRLRAELEWYYQCVFAKKRFVRIPFPVCKYSLGGMSERSDMAQKNIEETKTILTQYGYSTKKYDEGLNKSHLSRGVYKYLYNEWLSLKLSGYSMEKFLIYKGVKTVAIFGYGELGCHVINELINSCIDIKYLVESQERYPYNGIPIIHPNDLENVGSVDLVIVTAVMHYDDIYKRYYKKARSPFCTLEHLLEKMWNYKNNEN